MKKNQKWIILVLSVVLSLVLSACGIQGGPVSYLINGVWEENGNTVSVTAVKVIDSYTSDSGETVTAADGCKLLVISINARLSGEWKMASMNLRYEEKGFTAKLFKGPYETSGRADYIFEVPQNLISDETVQKYSLDVNLRNGEKTCTGNFRLLAR